MRGVFCCKDTDCAHAAICVEHFLAPCQFGQRQRFAVELFGLARIDLIKRTRRNAELHAHQHIIDIAGPIQHNFLKAKHSARLARIDILHHRAHVRTFADDLRRERFRVRKLGGRGYERQQHLACARRAAELHMPERTGSRIFVIGRQAGSGKNFARNSDDFIGAPVMQDAIAHGKHAVASGGINAGIQAAAAVSERRKHLAAIMAGIFHADDGQRVGEKLPHGGLFAPEVFAIGDGKLDAAAAAALGQRAFHKGNLL